MEPIGRVCMYMCVCVCMCIHIYVCACVYVYVYKLINYKELACVIVDWQVQICREPMVKVKFNFLNETHSLYAGQSAY